MFGIEDERGTVATYWKEEEMTCDPTMWMAIKDIVSVVVIGIVACVFFWAMTR